MVTLSRLAKRAMGYRELGDGEEITATFQVLHLYEILGVDLEAGAAVPIDDAVNGVRYSMALGSSVNELARLLVKDDYAEDEAEWSNARRCQPPYLLIKLGPFAPQTFAGGFVNDTGEQLVTFDGFQSAREEVLVAEAKALPSLVSGLACQFSREGDPTRFRKVDTCFFGLTPAGRIVTDLRLTTSIEVCVSRQMSLEGARALVERGVVHAKQFNRKVSGFFMLALEEADPLKRFLYFFLSIEIETNAVFRGLDHETEMAKLLNTPKRLLSASAQLFDGQRESWEGLKDKFVWCALCLWTHVTDADVKEFTRLKRIRNDIAHGTISAPPAEAVVAAQRLAEKLQSQKA